MSNTLTGLIPVIYEAYDIVAREMTGFINHVFRNSSAEQAALNQDVTYHIAPPATTGNITPGQTPPDDGDQTFGTDSLKITKSKYSPVRWNGEEQKSVKGTYTNIVRDQFAQSIRALVNEIEIDLALTGKLAASRAVGTAGTTPFGTAGDLSDFALPLQVLEDNGCPGSDRHIVVNSNSMANLRGKQSVLFKVNEAGTDAFLRRGIIGQVQGLDIGNSAGLTLHTKGTGTGFALNNVAGYPVGSKTIAVDTGTGTILAGDVFTNSQAGRDANKYVVKTALAAGSLVLNNPGTRVAWLDNDTVAVGNNYMPNLAFHRSAIHLVTRAPAMPVGADGQPIDMADDVMTVEDPITGLVFQVALYRLYRRIRYEIGIAWGQKAVKDDFIALLLG
ncbi:MAG TPA: P22 phage major capsid protein family protein [Steroidobacter sp.]|uniref:P22 phage major capsid protein family protein n=1 Tax=Steroidobacter sp. TaxID=1978227 RepID=UPI002ED82DFC